MSRGNAFPGSRLYLLRGDCTKTKEKRIFPRMIQAGNANRRDDPYDRKTRPMQTYPVRAEGSSVNGNLAFSLVPIICLKIQKPSNCLCVCYLAAVSSPPVVEPFRTVRVAHAHMFVKFPLWKSRKKRRCRQRARTGDAARPVPVLLNGPMMADLAAE